MGAALVMALVFSASTWPTTPLHSIEVFRVRSTPFGPVDRVAIEIDPKPGFHFYARDPDAGGEATTVQWSGGRGTEIDPLPDPPPQAIDEGGFIAAGYVGRTIFRARLGGKPHGTAIAKLHLAVCGNACFPIDYVVDEPVDTLPIRQSWLDWLLGLATIAIAGMTALTFGGFEFRLSKLTFVQKGSS